MVGAPLVSFSSIERIENTETQGKWWWRGQDSWWMCVFWGRVEAEMVWEKVNSEWFSSSHHGWMQVRDRVYNCVGFVVEGWTSCQFKCYKIIINARHVQLKPLFTVYLLMPRKNIRLLWKVMNRSWKFERDHAQTDQRNPWQSIKLLDGFSKWWRRIFLSAGNVLTHHKQ